MGVKRKTWAGQEDLLRGYLEQGMTLRQAAEAIGATYSATKAKARRLRLRCEDEMGQSRPTEAASASEWVLAGYEAENDLRPSGGLQSDLSAKGDLAGIEPLEPNAADPPVAAKRVRPARQRKKPEVGLTPLVLVLEHTEHNAADSTVEEELARGRHGDGSLPPYRDPVDAAAEAALMAGDVPICRVTGSQSCAGDRARWLECNMAARCLAPKPEPAKRRKSRRPPPVIETKARVWDFPAPGGCLFPHGDVGAPGFGFCAEPVAAAGAPYCQSHIQRVRQRGNKVEASDG